MRHYCTSFQIINNRFVGINGNRPRTTNDSRVANFSLIASVLNAVSQQFDNELTTRTTNCKCVSLQFRALLCTCVYYVYWWGTCVRQKQHEMRQRHLTTQLSFQNFSKPPRHICIFATLDLPYFAVVACACSVLCCYYCHTT